MANKVEESIYQSIRSNDKGMIVKHMETNTGIITDRLNTISLESMLKYGRPDINSQMYRALYGEDILASAGISLISPLYGSLALDGLKYPVTCLDTSIRDLVLTKLRLDILHGNGQVNEEKSEISFLWDASLCQNCSPIN
jgi:hypothetical protein